MNAYYDQGLVKKFGDSKVLGLGEIIRYNNRPKIKLENVAEHSFYVVETVVRLCDMFKVDPMTRIKALEFAMVHDLPEAILGDIPYDTKKNNPEIKKILDIAENEAMKTDFPEHAHRYKSLLEEEKEETVAALIVKLADTISVLTYSNREVSLGNRSPEMKQINEDAKERVHKMFIKLEEKLETTA